MYAYNILISNTKTVKIQYIVRYKLTCIYYVATNTKNSNKFSFKKNNIMLKAK